MSKPEELRAEKDHLKARDLDAYLNVWEGECRSYVAGALWTKERLTMAAPA
jgi:phage terminase large subunit